MTDDNPYRSPVDPQSSAGAAWSPPSVDIASAIPLSGVLTWADCRRASRAIVPKRVLLGAGLYLVAIAALAALLARLAPPTLSSTDALLIGVAATLCGIVAVFVVAMRFVYARQTWRIFKSDPLRRWVAENAIRTDTPTTTITEAWSQFDAYAASDQVLVLRERFRRGHLALPRSHCTSDADWLALRGLVEKNLPRGRYGLLPG